MPEILKKVKNALGITGDYQDKTIMEYITEVKLFLQDLGIPKQIVDSDAAAGVISRGVSDLWNYESGTLSKYFYQRAIQLIYSEKQNDVSS